MNLKNLYLQIPSFIDSHECEEYIDHFSLNLNNVGNESSYNVKSGKIEKQKSNVLPLSPEDEIYQKSVERSKIIISKYYDHLSKFDSFDTLTYIKQLKFLHSFRIIKYDVGDYIHQHVDKIDYTYGSFTIELSTKDSYEGGEFSFFNDKERIDFDQGTGLIFPASYFWTHETKPVTKGTRYCVNCFLTNKSSKQISLFSSMPDDNPFAQPILNEKFWK